MDNKQAIVDAISTNDKHKKYELEANAPTKKNIAKNRTMVLLDRAVVNRLCCCKNKIGNTYNSVISNLLDEYENKINKDGQ